MNISSKIVSMALVLFGTTISSSFAYNNAVCEPETQKLCYGLIRQGTQVLDQCLRDHYNELSSACQAKVARVAKTPVPTGFPVAPINVAKPKK
jgi:hypothetical protein